jgi:DNA-binding response OmpR family regulator
MKALVVDHDAGLRELLATILRRHGYAVITAGDAAQALAHWRVHRPDLVVLEPALPHGDGLALCRHLCQATAMPVLLVSTHDSDAEVHQGLAAGASDYVRKPFSPQHLVARIQRLLQRPRPEPVG